MANTNFKNAMMLVLKHEGGFQADKRDTGNSDDGHGNQGSTMLGVTAKVWANYIGAPAPIEVMKGLTHEMVLPLYKTEYWDRCKCSNLADGLDYSVADFAINGGVSRASKTLQKLVKAKEDGVIGIKTLDKVNAQDPKKLIKDYHDAREAFYKKAKGFKTYGKGWLKRNADCLKESLKMAEGA